MKQDLAETRSALHRENLSNTRIGAENQVLLDSNTKLKQKLESSDRSQQESARLGHFTKARMDALQNENSNLVAQASKDTKAYKELETKFMDWKESDEAVGLELVAVKEKLVCAEVPHQI